MTVDSIGEKNVGVAPTHVESSAEGANHSPEAVFEYFQLALGVWCMYARDDGEWGKPTVNGERTQVETVEEGVRNRNTASPDIEVGAISPSRVVGITHQEGVDRRIHAELVIVRLSSHVLSVDHTHVLSSVDGTLPHLHAFMIRIREMNTVENHGMLAGCTASFSCD